MPSFASAARLFRTGLVAMIALTLILSATGTASANHTTRDRSASELFSASNLAEAVTEHQQDFWDAIFLVSDLPYETPYAILYDSYNYGRTGCGLIETYTYSWYCLSDDTVYINVEQVADLRLQEGDLFASVLGVGQPMSLSVLDRVGGLSFDRGGTVSRASQEAAACLTGVWTAALWYEDIINEHDVLSAMEGLETIGRTLPDAYLEGFDTEDPQYCLDVMLPAY